VKRVGGVAAVRHAMECAAMGCNAMARTAMRCTTVGCAALRHGYRLDRAFAAPVRVAAAACMVFRNGVSRAGYGGARRLAVIRTRGTLCGIRGSFASVLAGRVAGRYVAARYHGARPCMWPMTSSWLP
jgi:hypothetical protein